MDRSITIGLDIAKSVFQVHAVDAVGRVVVRRRLRRAEVLKFFSKQPPALVALEACGGAHHWARQLGGLGHEVRLLAPSHVKPYVKRGRKSDAADAAALAEAVGRAQMRTVPTKTAEAQALASLHRTRELFVRHRTGLICALRSHLSEFGIVSAQGKGGVRQLRTRLDTLSEDIVPALAIEACRLIVAQIDDATTRIDAIEARIVATQRSCEAGRRLATIPGVGPITASALMAFVPDAARFASGTKAITGIRTVIRNHQLCGMGRLGLGVRIIPNNACCSGLPITSSDSNRAHFNNLKCHYY